MHANGSALQPVTNFWAHFRRRLNLHGSAGVLWRLVVRGIDHFGKLELVGVYERRLDAPLECLQARIPVTVGLATLSDIDQLAGLTAWQEDLGSSQRDAVVKAMTDRLRRGHVCFIARDGERIVHCTWVAFDWYDTFVGRFVVLPNDAAYVGGSYTATDHRGLAIHTEVNWAVLTFLRARGYHRAFAYVDFDNRSSRKTYELMRWEKRGDLVAFTPRGCKTKVLRLRGCIDPIAERDLPPKTQSAATLPHTLGPNP